MLRNHIVLGDSLRAKDIPEGKTELEAALDGAKLAVTAGNGSVTVGTPGGETAKVIVADLYGGKAVVHIIDAVLVPEAKPAAPAAKPEAAAADVTPVPAADVPCTIKAAEGDTLDVLAKKYGSTVDKLLSLNKGIKDKNLITIGQEIKLKAKC